MEEPFFGKVKKQPRRPDHMHALPNKPDPVSGLPQGGITFVYCYQEDCSVGVTEEVAEELSHYPKLTPASRRYRLPEEKPSREPGYYWVKFQGEWTVGEYTDGPNILPGWGLMANDHMPEESEFEEVGPRIDLPRGLVEKAAAEDPSPDVVQRLIAYLKREHVEVRVHVNTEEPAPFKGPGMFGHPIALAKFTEWLEKETRR